MLQVRNLNISSPLILAPMAGVTHSAFRRLVLSFGGVGLLTTEMLSAKRLPCENQRVSPFLIKTEGERPLCYQLLVTDPEEVEPAIDALHRFGAEAVDLNFGCPAPRVRQAGGGFFLMDQPKLAEKIVSRVRRATGLPVSAKIRLGEKLDSEKLIFFCRVLEDAGADLLTVHARLRGESFARRPHWDWITKVKQCVRIPVVANGGIFSVADAVQCLETSGADGLMIGRGVVERPWLIAETGHHLYNQPAFEDSIDLYAAYTRFVENLAVFRPERRLGRLKEFTHYFAKNFRFGHHFAAAVQSSPDLSTAVQRTDDFFNRLGVEEQFYWFHRREYNSP